MISEDQEYLLNTNLEGSLIPVSEAFTKYPPKEKKKSQNTISAYDIQGLEGKINVYFKDNWDTVLLEHTNNNSQNIQYFSKGAGGRYTYKDATPNSVEILPDCERIHCFNETFECDWGTKTMTAYEVLLKVKFNKQFKDLCDWARESLGLDVDSYTQIHYDLITSDKGKILPLVENLAIIFDNDVKYKELCGKNIYDNDELTLMKDRKIADVLYHKGAKLKDIENSVIISIQCRFPTFTHMGRDIRNVLENDSKKRSFIYCPFLEWIKERPWDGKFRVRNILTSMGAEDNVLNREILPLMMKQLIRRQLNPYEQNELSMVLIGPQDVGKTYLLKKLALEGIHDAPSDLYASFPPNMLNTKMDEANRQMDHKYFVVFNELELLTSGLLNSLKDLCSSTKIVGLRRMRRDAVDVPRRFIICATTNKEEIFDDTSGERRWVPVVVNKPIKDNEFLYNKMDAYFLQQSWAEVYAEYSEQEILNRLKDEMKILQEKTVEGFMAHNEALEGIIMSYVNDKHVLVSHKLLQPFIKDSNIYNVSTSEFGKVVKKLKLKLIKKKLEKIGLSVYYDPNKIKDPTNEDLLKLHDKYLKGGNDDGPSFDGGSDTKCPTVINSSNSADIPISPSLGDIAKEPVVTTNTLTVTIDRSVVTDSQAEQGRLYLDFETYASINLRTCGVDRYINDPTFEPLLLSYALNGDPVQIIDFTQGKEIPQNIKDAIQSTSVTKIAFNDKFDKAVLRKIGFDIINWHDTSAQARLLNLPAGLGDLGAFFKIQNQKLESGDALMKIFCMPRTKKGVLIRTLPTDNPEKWEEFKKYSKQDVAALRQCQIILDRDYPPVTAIEKEIMKLDTEINERGVLVDLPCVHKILEVSENLTMSIIDDFKKLTGLDSTKSPKQLIEWLFSQGIETKSVKKEVVADLLKKENLPAVVKQVLLLRQKTATSSISKYTTMLERIGSDSRLRGEFSYAGARTGRWKSYGVQVHNLPRTTIALEELDDCRNRVDSISDLKMFHELIRTMFIPGIGKLFVVVDASQIEARVTSWIANDEWRQKIFVNNGDIYKESAAAMYGIQVSEVSKKQREVGKILELAFSYGGGVDAVKIFDRDNIIPDDQKEAMKNKWRSKNPKIVQAWSSIENTCIKAYYNPNQTMSWARLKFCYKSNISCLFIMLPSGRSIVYPRFKYNSYAGGNKLSYHYNEKEFTNYKGKGFNNVIQAISRDLLADYMLRVKKHNIVMHVHDEVVLEVPEEKADAVLQEAIKEMRIAPDWAKDLPIDGEGFICSYYRKG